MNTLLRSGIHFIYGACIAPRSATEDSRRHEFILNVILNGSIILIGVLDVFIAISILREGPAYKGISFAAFTMLLALFIGLLALSRRGRFQFASYLLLGFYYASATYCTIRWGVELPLAGFGFALTIIASSVLVSTRFAFFTTVVISLTLLAVGYGEVFHHLTPALSWKRDFIDMEDPAELSVILFLVMTLCWLSNREMEASLRRARKSEHALIIERDSLEIKVDERTRELKQVQHEKLAQLYRFAEFGRLSSGIFHDLMNSITTVVANVEALDRAPERLPEVKSYLVKAVAASKRMNEFMATARKQMQTTGEKSLFSANKEVRDAISILTHRAQETEIEVKYRVGREIITYGSALKFHQVAVNLIANAIDASAGIPGADIINVSLSQNGPAIVFRVTDRGAGIAPEVMPRIFDPFFTTKGALRGVGLGLSTTKSIIEKEFEGTISVQSEPGKGASFTVTFPLQNERDKDR